MKDSKELLPGTKITVSGYDYGHFEMHEVLPESKPPRQCLVRHYPPGVNGSALIKVVRLSKVKIIKNEPAGEVKS